MDLLLPTRANRILPSSNNNHNQKNESSYLVEVILEIKKCQKDMMEILHHLQRDVSNVRHDISSILLDDFKRTTSKSSCLSSIKSTSDSTKFSDKDEDGMDTDDDGEGILNVLGGDDGVAILPNGLKDAPVNECAQITWEDEERMQQSNDMNTGTNESYGTSTHPHPEGKAVSNSNNKVTVRTKTSSPTNVDKSHNIQDSNTTKTNTNNTNRIQMDTTVHERMDQNGKDDATTKDMVLRSSSTTPTTDYDAVVAVATHNNVPRRNKRIYFSVLASFISDAKHNESKEGDSSEDNNTNPNKTRETLHHRRKDLQPTEQYRNSIRSLFQIITCKHDTNEQHDLQSVHSKCSTAASRRTWMEHHVVDCGLFTKKGNSFQSFSILSIVDDMLTTDKVSHWGSYHTEYSPVTLNAACVCDQFPNTSMASSNAFDTSKQNEEDIDNNTTISEISNESNETLFPFCFPHGLQIRFLPKKDMDAAHRLGWIGRSADRYQMHAFHDRNGKVTYGISITIKEEMDHPPNVTSTTMQAFKILRLRRKAIFLIVQFWRKYRAHYILTYTSNNSPSNNNRKPIRKIRRRVRRRGSQFANIVKASFGPRTKSLDGSLGQHSLGLSSEFVSPATSTCHDSQENGDVCIVEKCYIFVGTKPENHSLLFSALQKLVDLEREARKQSFSNTTIESTTATNTDIYNTRHLLLEEIQYRLCLTPDQVKIQYPTSELKHITTNTYTPNTNRKVHEIVLNDTFPKISFFLPLPQMSSEWGVARLIIRLKLPFLMNILMLLLLEKSVLIVGHTYEEVSACVFALLDLLKPYKWASIFIPILSDDMMDFISSPVPFIAGRVIVDENNYKNYWKDIQMDCRIQKQIQFGGLSVVDIVSGDILWTEDVDVRKRNLTHGTNMMYYWYPYTQLNEYQTRLEYLYNTNNNSSSISTLQSFKLFFHYGASLKESLTIKSIKYSIQKHLLSFSGLLSQSSDGWNVYKQQPQPNNNDEEEGSLTATTFSPIQFYASLAHVTEYQKLFSTSQLLATYYEDKRRVCTTSMHNNKNAHGHNSAIFIADWVYFNWKKYKEKH